MKKSLFCLALSAALFPFISAHAQFSLGALVGFGGSDGWLSTNEYFGVNALDGSGNQRSIAYGNGHLYLQTGTAAAPTVKILNKLTGAELGSLNMTGVSGGARALVGLGVGGDGAIYGANLQTALSGSAPFKVYRWATEGSAATTAYSGNPLNGARLGDSFDVSGSGAGTRAVAGFAASPVVAGNNGYTVVDTTAGTQTQVTFGGTPPAAGDFRLGITFANNATTVIGDQGSVANDTRLTTYSGGAGTLVATLTLSAAGERQMDYFTLGGIPLLATVETGGTPAGNGGMVRIYDMTTPSAPVFLGSLRNQTGSITGNGNASGGVAWGDAYYESGLWKNTLYAMNANNGIQAFLVAVPEPSAAALAMIGGLLFAGRRLRRRQS